ncbi:MAG: ABC transporter ATP-binding protein/permease [Treponema sp.]|nr:ABC transporter ATP-binding protein/permease [Treponema sp.]
MARNRYDIDEDLEDSYDFGQLRRLGKYVKPHAGAMTFITLLMLLTAALGMLYPYFLKIVMDECIPNKDFRKIIMLALATLGISAFTALALKVKINIMTKIGQGIVHDLRKDLFTHVLKLPFSYFDSRPHGKIQVRIVNYVNNLSDVLSNGLVNTVTDLCSLIFIIIFMFTINLPLTLVVLCGLPVFIAYVFILKKYQRKAWRQQSNKQSNLNAYISESINGIRVTQSFVREEENIRIFDNLSASYRKAWMHAVTVSFLMGPFVQLISTATNAAALVLGVRWIMTGFSGVTVGTLVAFTAYISRFWQPITTLADFINNLLTAVSYVERIFETIDEPVKITDREGASTLPPVTGKVEYKNVCFSYDEGQRVLDDINFTVEPGESVAIVGPTGAGKSTIVNLLSRFYNPESGQVLVDGHDLQDVTIRSLRTQMGVMMQDSFIFKGTIMDNIRYGNMEASDEQVMQAAKTVCAHDFIMQLEDGYQTEVNERGTRLSVGQRQLISFARALLADPRILILDEATSSIDTETELLLQRGLNKLLKGRTSFIIAHRLSTIKNCGTIFYVDHGKIVERGSHYELMAKLGPYYKLYSSQFALL